MFNSNESSSYSLDDCNSEYDFSIDLSNSLSQNNSVKIPKIIMQTWKDKNIPEKWKSSPLSIKKYLPDWKYVLMTDEDNRNFVKKHFPNFLKYYDGFPHNIMRADAIRYCFLYVFGGLYMDLDFEILPPPRNHKGPHPINSLFTSDNEVYLVSSSNVGSYLTNSFMASKPGCKLWLDAIEYMKKPVPYYYIGKHLTVMHQTGSFMLSSVAKNSKIVYGNLPVKLILPCSVCNIKCRTKGAYLKQLEGSSWITYDTKCYNFFMCNYKQLIIAVALILFVILIALLIQWFNLI